ncbi:MAG: hypothetical protein SGPRY_011901, partial [Prymnesium sp.]
ILPDKRYFPGHTRYVTMDAAELLAWCHAQHIYTRFEVSLVLDADKWKGVPPRSVCEFLERVPSRARALPYHILCHNVAYATFAHMPCQTNDDVIFEFMQDWSVLTSPYTVWYMLSMRGLSKYIVRLVDERVHIIGHLYDIYAKGQYLLLLEKIGVHEGTDAHDRFVSLGDVLRLAALSLRDEQC